MFVPLKVRVPEPAFVNPPDPDITPETVLLFVSPAVRVCELAISIFPAPSIEATVSLASTSYTAPDSSAIDKVPETVKAELIFVFCISI